jgi:uncharacterized short protein YbdD (DUF466 family)
MPAPLTPEQDFLTRLQQGRGASGLPAQDAGLFDQPDGKMRCLVPVQSLPASPRLPAPLAWWLPNLLWRALWQSWRYLREVSGDDAYERYLQHLARFHPGERPMTRAEHFKLTQEQKWDRVSRCC